MDMCSGDEAPGPGLFSGVGSTVLQERGWKKAIRCFLFDMFACLDAMGRFVRPGKPVSVRKTWTKRSKVTKRDPRNAR